MTIERNVGLHIIDDKIVPVFEKIKLTDQELHDAYEEYLLISKIEDVSQVLKEIEEEDEYFSASDIGDKDRELMARDLIEEIDTDENYWDKVRSSVEKYL